MAAQRCGPTSNRVTQNTVSKRMDEAALGHIKSRAKSDECRVSRRLTRKDAWVLTEAVFWYWHRSGPRPSTAMRKK